MPYQSQYTGPDIYDSFDPRYAAPPQHPPNLPYLPPEPPMVPAPVQGSAGPSLPVQASAVAPGMAPVAPEAVAQKKKRGILGAIGGLLEGAFMPEPDSLYAAALRGGIWDAKANQKAYKQQQETLDLERSAANYELKQKMTQPQYKVFGNSILVTPPGGGEAYIMQPPRTESEFEALSKKWSSLDDGDPLKKLIEGYLLKSNATYVLESKAGTAKDVARTRAGATTGAAQIRANAPPKTGKPALALPPGAVVVKK